MLLGACCSLWAADSKPGPVSVVIAPAVALENMGNNAVRVKIRLSPASSAHIWLSNTCADTTAGPYILSLSGDYTIPVSTIPGAGDTVCVVSVLDGLTARMNVPNRPKSVFVDTSSTVQTVSTI